MSRQIGFNQVNGFNCLFDQLLTIQKSGWTPKNLFIGPIELV